MSAAEQTMQRWSEPNVGMLVRPGVFTGSVRAIDAVRRLLVEELERAKLCLADSHWYCP
jgi:hypothetical protein